MPMTEFILIGVLGDPHEAVMNFLKRHFTEDIDDDEIKFDQDFRPIEEIVKELMPREGTPVIEYPNFLLRRHFVDPAKVEKLRFFLKVCDYSFEVPRKMLDYSTFMKDDEFFIEALTDFQYELIDKYVKNEREALQEGFKKYQGAALKLNEYNAMVELEQAIGEPIPWHFGIAYQYCEEVADYEFGFSTSDGYVVKLNLEDRRLRFAPTTFGKFMSDLIPKRMMPSREKVAPLAENEQAVLAKIEDNIGGAIPRFDELDKETFGYTAFDGHVTGLSVFDMKLQELPEGIGQLTALEELNLIQNELTTLPDSFYQLQSLKLLNLCENAFETLSNKIGLLSSLEILDLSRNMLNSLPGKIGLLSSLRELDLEENQISSLPRRIRQLTSLHVLDVRHNFLRSLPDWIKELKRNGCEVYTNVKQGKKNPSY